ncbi:MULTISPECIES: N-6 DNA methylase [Pseudomonas]|uniref:N-6 DNA methylase n=1 Tax=Pseudomonas TaxID=286 RepID=UPI000DAED7BA|nr:MULTISPECIES: N-6 DNA methylase [Pseudomonas]MBF0641592.1 N-6 DNA methylase [Pseudomonas protegens]PZW49730.1 N-6 DNA methylase [Pseudomonas sp. URMO17WK12:I2]
MQSQSNEVTVIKQLLREYADSSVRLGTQQDDCLLWGFTTLLAFQTHNLDEGQTLHRPVELPQITGQFIAQLNEKGFNTRLLTRLEPPRIHILEHLVYVARRCKLNPTELTSILDWIMRQLSIETQGSITPKEIASIMTSLLDVKQGQTLLDPAMGSGAFLQAVKAQGIFNGHFVGIEKNEKIAFIASLYAYIQNHEEATIKLGGAFYHLQEQGLLFDYVISNPPVYRIPKPQALHQFRETLEHRQISSEMSLNFVQLGLQKLSRSGRAAFLVHMGTLFSATEIKVREEWIKAGLIKTVISLPDKLLPHTSNKCAILIFSKETSKNKNVTLVKADDLSNTNSNGQNTLQDNALDIIIRRSSNKEKTYNNAIVTIDEIVKANYSLYPDHYVLKPINEVAEKISKKWVPIEQLAIAIQGTRNLGRLQGGESEVIVGKSVRQMYKNDPYLEKKDFSSFAENIIRTEPYDLLIQRIGDNPAVHMVLPEQSGMIVDQTVFIVRFYEIKPGFINFVAEFLNSDRGANHIASFCHNVTVQTLTKKVVHSITIPIADDSMQSLLMEIAHAEKSLSQEKLKANALKVKIFEGLGYEKIENDFDSIRFSLNTLENALKNKDKISYKVSNQYPYPIAFAYRNMYADREWSAIYENQMKFGELILSFMVSVSLGLLNHHQKPHHLNLSGLASDLSEALKGGISPGHWQKLLHSSCLILREIPDCPLSTQLAASWFKGRGNKLSEFGRETISALISKLNDKKHWRGPKGSHASKDAVTAHQEHIDRALLDIEFFSKWDFFINDKLDYSSNSEMFTCSASLLRGDHPCFEQVDIVSNTPLSVGDIYCKIGDHIISLSPFLLSTFSPSTQRTEIFSLDKKSKAGEYIMKSFDSGQTIHIPNKLAANLDSWFLKNEILQAPSLERVL